MKKLAFILVIITLATMLFACDTSPKTEPVQTTVAKGIAWSDKTADKNLAGAWQFDDGSQPEYYIFTEDCKVQIVRGTVYFEGNVTYGIDTDGNRIYFSDFYYMAGELNYTVSGDKVVFMNEDGEQRVMDRADYKAPELKVYEDFNAENPLVGTWYNEQYQDSYTFNADGTATYLLNNTERSYVSHIDYTYKEADGYLYLTYDAGEGVQEDISTYTINLDTLNINGEGDYKRQ